MLLLVGGTRAFGIIKIVVWRLRPPKTSRIPVLFGLRVPRNITKQVLSEPPAHKTSVIAVLFGSRPSECILNAPMSVSLYRFHLFLVPQKKPLPESSHGAAPKSSPPLNIDERRPRKLYTSGAQLRPLASNIRLEWPRRNARSDNNYHAMWPISTRFNYLHTFAILQAPFLPQAKRCYCRQSDDSNHKAPKTCKHWTTAARSKLI